MRTVIACLLVVLPLFGCAPEAQEPKTDEQKTLYAVGLLVSKNLSSFNLSKSDLEMVQAGLADGVLNKKPQVELQTYGPKIQQLQQERLTALAEKQKEAGKAFAEKMAAEKDSTKTASGMIYIPVQPGTGASPKATDVVKVHYTGTLTNGTVFDSSVQRGEPATFPLNQVIPCWTEGLQLMKVGGKAKLVCPPDIAYGDRGHPPVIMPGSTLTFDVELLEIVKPAKK